MRYLSYSLMLVAIGVLATSASAATWTGDASSTVVIGSGQTVNVSVPGAAGNQLEVQFGGTLIIDAGASLTLADYDVNPVVPPPPTTGIAKFDGHVEVNGTLNLYGNWGDAAAVLG